MTESMEAIIERCTDEKSTHDDWNTILDVVCDKCYADPKRCLKLIMKRIFNQNPHVCLRALTILEACSSNVGRVFNLEMCSRDFVRQVQAKIGNLNPKVRIRFFKLIKDFSDAFRDQPELILMHDLYQYLKIEFGKDMEIAEEQEAIMTNRQTRRNAEASKEDEDINTAIALSLREAEKNKGRSYPVTTYPTINTSTLGGAGSGRSASPAMVGKAAGQPPSEPKKARALYDFEAVEDNEITFKAGEIILVLDDKDAHWWKGSNHRGEGLFPYNFVTYDLLAEPEQILKKVNFNEDVEVKQFSDEQGGSGAPLVVEAVGIDEERIDRCLQMIEEADPTGEQRADPAELAVLEEQCRQMGPMIDQELEKIDRRHNMLSDMNQMLLDSFGMYNELMSLPSGLGAASMYNNPGGMMPPPQYGQQMQHPNMMSQQQQQMSMNYPGMSYPSTYSMPTAAVDSGTVASGGYGATVVGAGQQYNPTGTTGTAENTWQQQQQPYQMTGYNPYQQNQQNSQTFTQGGGVDATDQGNVNNGTGAAVASAPASGGVVVDSSSTQQQPQHMSSHNPAASSGYSGFQQQGQVPPVYTTSLQSQYPPQDPSAYGFYTSQNGPSNISHVPVMTAQSSQQPLL